MDSMKRGEGTVYTESRMSQIGIGQLVIETMAYVSELDGTVANKEIRVSSLKVANAGNGWGKDIFEGTLEQLIDLIQWANDKKQSEQISVNGQT